MANTYDVIAAEAEKAATVRSIADIIGTTITDAKGFTCMTFRLDNKDGAKTLHVQDDNDATVANDNVKIAANTLSPFWPWNSAKYDLREIFIRVSADDPTFAIEIVWG